VRKKSGITNSQARYLTSLSREAGERYRGDGMTRQQAGEEIDRLLRKLGRVPRDRTFNSETPAEAAARRQKARTPRVNEIHNQIQKRKQ
jgi:hypothetical protein